MPNALLWFDSLCFTYIYIYTYIYMLYHSINTLKPRRNRQHFGDDIFKCNFFNENIWISIKLSLEFVPMGSIDIIPALVQIMVWRRPGYKPLTKPMMVSLPMHICIIRSQSVKEIIHYFYWNRTTPNHYIHIERYPFLIQWDLHKAAHYTGYPYSSGLLHLHDVSYELIYNAESRFAPSQWDT